MFLHYLGKNELFFFNFHVCNKVLILVLFPQNFFVLDPDAAHLRECPWRTIRALAVTVLLKLSSFVSVSDILLELSEFHINRVNDFMVCYEVQELRTRYDAKQQHVF